MIDVNQIIRDFGVWGLLILSVAGFIWLSGRGIFARVQSGVKQSDAMTTMALEQTRRANSLSDVRFSQAKKIAELEARLSVMEPMVARLPKLEQDYAVAVAKLDEVTLALSESLAREVTKDRLIEKLERYIEKLEGKVKQDEDDTVDGDTGDLFGGGIAVDGTD